MPAHDPSRLADVKSCMKVLTGAALGVVGVAALSGCSPASGTAALVNDVAIPDARVTSFADGCSAVLASSPQLAQSPNQLRPQMVKWAVLDEMSRQQAEKMGSNAPDDAQMRDYIEQSGLSQLLGNGECAEAALGVARHDLIALSLGSNMDSYFGAYTVEVNPRYGTWDQANLAVSGSGSLSELVDL